MHKNLFILAKLTYKGPMNSYFYILLNKSNNLDADIDDLARQEFGCLGIEEYNIEEEKVDEILGDRSYSGGDVPESVIDEVGLAMQAEANQKKYYFENKKDAQFFQKKIQDLFGCVTELYESEVEDWNETWRKSYRPIDIDGKFLIIPEWEEQDDKNNSLLIYPGQGFGTGSHETTFLCLKIFFNFLEDKKVEHVLDFGCGSGILGLSVLKRQSDANIDLYDIDQSAIENAKQNIELNNFSDKDIKLYLPVDKDKINVKYDLVFANILQNVLLLESDYLVTHLKKGGSLILSGLLLGQEDEVIETFVQKNNKLKYITTYQKNDWVAVLLEHE